MPHLIAIVDVVIRKCGSLMQCQCLHLQTMLKRATRTAVTSSALNAAEDERREDDELVEVVVSSGNEMSEGARRKQPARASLRKQATASEEVL